jgi:hypothetical protein
MHPWEGWVDDASCYIHSHLLSIICKLLPNFTSQQKHDSILNQRWCTGLLLHMWLQLVLLTKLQCTSAMLASMYWTPFPSPASLHSHRNDHSKHQNISISYEIWALAIYLQTKLLQVKQSLRLPSTVADMTACNLKFLSVCYICKIAEIDPNNNNLKVMRLWVQS